MEFANKEWLWALLIVPAVAGWYYYRYHIGRANITMSSLDGFEGISTSIKEWAYNGLIVFRLAALVLIIVALARPQSSSSWQDETTEGIDIVLALDISSSMLAKDLKPNRLEASKEVAMEFIQTRPNDRMGLVVYAGESFTQCPLTTDHSVLANLFRDIEFGMINDGTAIGMGLATAVNRLKDSEAKSKVIVLLTDGSNNAGTIPPLTAAEIAKTYNIRVYSIGVGTRGKAPTPVAAGPYGGIQYANREVKIDEKTLKEIAKTTGGLYYRATDNSSLANIYNEIDQLEKSRIEVTEYKNKTEKFFPFLLYGLGLLVLEYLLRNTYFKSLV
ncbi:MAG: aerotolerance regulator BatA [Crocinitomicaceae bacterium]|nr:aerotolerance regulator BatA [Crocinitomicaceae bacterium]